MGLRFRKTAALGPFRLTFSKSGVGVSTGVPGARVSIGSSGARVSVGLPGTGVGYQQGVSLTKLVQMGLSLLQR